jgi:hypothetical protein
MSDKPNLRDGIIHNAVEARRADETRIMQKVNAANREAFLAKFPGHLEHSMRLTSERLLNCLNKPEGINLANPETWPANPIEIAALAEALYHLDLIRQRWE